MSRSDNENDIRRVLQAYDDEIFLEESLDFENFLLASGNEMNRDESADIDPNDKHFDSSGSNIIDDAIVVNNPPVNANLDINNAGNNNQNNVGDSHDDGAISAQVVFNFNPESLKW